jgi:hypothetical protein
LEDEANGLWRVGHLQWAWVCSPNEKTRHGLPQRVLNDKKDVSQMMAIMGSIEF